MLNNDDDDDDNSGISTGNFLLILGILHVHGYMHVWLHISPGINWILEYRYGSASHCKLEQVPQLLSSKGNWRSSYKISILPKEKALGTPVNPYLSSLLLNSLSLDVTALKTLHISLLGSSSKGFIFKYDMMIVIYGIWEWNDRVVVGWWFEPHSSLNKLSLTVHLVVNRYLVATLGSYKLWRKEVVTILHMPGTPLSMKTYRGLTLLLW